MRILSLDTSFSFFNFSVLEEGKVELIYYYDSHRKTLENLPALFSDLGIELGDYDAFAVSVGVGYLTSLRIGVTFMKTSAYLLNKPIVAYENLELMALYTPVEGPKIPYLKVSTNIFYRVFEDEHASEVRIFKGEEIKGCGISLRVFSEVKLGSRQVFLPFFPFSSYGAIYAYERLKSDPAGDDPFGIEPVYLKPPL